MLKVFAGQGGTFTDLVAVTTNQAIASLRDAERTLLRFAQNADRKVEGALSFVAMPTSKERTIP